MSQEILPLFIEGENSINVKVSYEYNEKDHTVYYYLFCLPFYSHLKSDKRGFRIVTAQLIMSGHCRNYEIIQAFGVSSISVKRSVKKYREGGISAFFKTRATRGRNVLTDEVLSQVQQLLNEGESVSDIAQELSLKSNTISKAIQAGKLIKVVKKT